MLPTTYEKITFVDTRAQLIRAQLPPPAAGEVLIRARCSLISPGTERAALTRLWDDADFRQSPGYALAGDVLAVGHDVSDLAAGDRVVSLAPHGSHALLSGVPWMVLPIPDSLGYEMATFSTLASVALHALRRMELALGETVVIIGAGLIGLMATQLAKMDGAQRVIVLDLADNRLALAAHYGADVTINPSLEDPVEAVLAATGQKGAPAILEAAGNPRVIPLAFKLAAEGGRIVLVGALEEEVPISFHAEFIRRELSLIAAFQPFNPVRETIYWRWTQQANRRLVLELLARGQLRTDEMLTHRFPAGEAPRVYEQIKAANREMLGVLLQWPT